VNRLRKAAQVWIDAFDEHTLLTYASAIAFQVLKSLIPLVLLATALVGAIGRKDLWTTHLGPSIRPHFDPPVYGAADFMVQKIFANDSVPVIVLAALLTIWYVSGGVRAIMEGINRIYGAREDRPVWHRWLLSVGLACGVVAGIVGAILLVMVVPKPGGAWAILAVPGRWLGAVVALALATGLLVRLGPAKRRPKKWASAGAVLVIATWLLTSLVFRWYVGSIANFKTAVGQLTVFIVLMAYVYASSIVFLVGVQLDEFLREDATAGERGILDVLRGK
jgi:membrane protein